MPARWRPRARIPRALNTDFQDLAHHRSVNASALLYMWVLEAYYAAVDAIAAGIDPGLPRPSTLPGDEAADVRWSQGEEQYRECERAIDAAGSSVSAVVTDSVRRWVAAGGDLQAQRRTTHPARVVPRGRVHRQTGAQTRHPAGVSSPG